MQSFAEAVLARWRLQIIHLMMKFSRSILNTEADHMFIVNETLLDWICQFCLFNFKLSTEYFKVSI